jgi:hypothetical protein
MGNFLLLESLLVGIHCLLVFILAKKKKALTLYFFIAGGIVV